MHSAPNYWESPSRIQETISPGSEVFAWLVEIAADVTSKFQPGVDGGFDGEGPVGIFEISAAAKLL